MAKTAIVVGGGIGGLTCALGLARKGIGVTVLEQAAEFGEVGAGIQIAPNASRVLLTLGLGSELEKTAFRPEAGHFRSWRGSMLRETPMGDEIARHFGSPSYNFHRADLMAVLADAVERCPEVVTRLGAPCTAVSQCDQEVAVTTPDEELRADLAVGADGIKSVVRETLFGPEKPRFTGCVAWRGVIPVERLADLELPPVVTVWMGPGGHVVTYFLRGGALFNVVAIIEKTGWEVESWTVPGEKSEMIADFSGWHPTVQALLRAIDPATCFKWALHDRDPLPRWSKGRVTLLGDACHPTLPFMAQGACMAIEDAVVLAECVAPASDVPAALERYEGLRKERTARVQNGSRRNKTLFHRSGPKALLRNAGMRWTRRSPLSAIQELFGYDAFEAARHG